MKGEIQQNMVRLSEREGKLEDLDRKVNKFKFFKEIWFEFLKLKLG